MELQSHRISQFVDTLVKKVVSTFTKPFEVQVAELSKRVDELEMRIDHLKDKSKEIN